ncbi:hypothetical protein RUM43_002056 [Polyplax serrata]|uniref:Uncharacterized protein n=1 Tax=Polyplax serrata TaxID=468196 RepID=A0AAN8NSQ6_POLSC
MEKEIHVALLMDLPFSVGSKTGGKHYENSIEEKWRRAKKCTQQQQQHMRSDMSYRRVDGFSSSTPFVPLPAINLVTQKIRGTPLLAAVYKNTCIQSHAKAHRLIMYKKRFRFGFQFPVEDFT